MLAVCAAAVHVDRFTDYFQINSYYLSNILWVIRQPVNTLYAHVVPRLETGGMGDEGFLAHKGDLGVAEKTSTNISKNKELIAVTQELQICFKRKFVFSVEIEISTSHL